MAGTVQRVNFHWFLCVNFSVKISNEKKKQTTFTLQESNFFGVTTQSIVLVKIVDKSFDEIIVYNCSSNELVQLMLKPESF